MKDSEEQQIAEEGKNTKDVKKVANNQQGPKSEESEQIAKNDYIIQQIKVSLFKEESQPTIIKLSIVSFIIFLIIMMNGIVFYLLPTNYITSNRTRMLHIKSSFYLLRYSVVNLNLMRELILLSFPEYDSLYCDKDQYRTNYTNKLISTYVQSSSNLNTLMLESGELSTEHYNFIYTNISSTDVIENDFKVYSYNLSLISSVYRTITSMFEVSQLNLTTLIPLNKDVFFYMKNTLNGLLLSFQSFTDIYMHELKEALNAQKTMMIIVFFVFIILFYSSFFFISSAFTDVVKRKESYLEIFFEIGNNVIMYSLDKCETFAKKIQNENKDDLLIAAEDNDDMHEDYLLIKDVTSPASSQSKKGNKGDSKSIALEAKKSSKEILIIKTGFFGFLSVLVLYSMVILILYILFRIRVNNYIELFYNENMIQVNNILYYIVIREFMFDPNATVYNTPIREYVETMLKTHYTEQEEKKDIIKKYQNRSVKIIRK